MNYIIFNFIRINLPVCLEPVRDPQAATAVDLGNTMAVWSNYVCDTLTVDVFPHKPTVSFVTWRHRTTTNWAVLDFLSPPRDPSYLPFADQTPNNVTNEITILWNNWINLPTDRASYRCCRNFYYFSYPSALRLSHLRLILATARVVLYEAEMAYAYLPIPFLVFSLGSDTSFVLLPTITRWCWNDYSFHSHRYSLPDY